MSSSQPSAGWPPRMRRLLLSTTAVLVALLAGGCLPNTATPYQSDSLAGGYGEESIANDRLRVYFDGNSFIDFETMEASWLERCADLTLAHGYEGFTIVSKAEFMGDHGSKRVEGVIVMRMGPIQRVKHKSFDAQAVATDVGQLLARPRCQFGNICNEALRTSPANGLFTRITLLNLTANRVTAAIAGMHDDEEHGGASVLLYPDASADRHLTITTEACAYVYDMPRDMNDAPWRVFRASDTSIPIQIANDMALHIVSPHAGNWLDDASKLTTMDWASPIKPVSTTCH
ncbi:MAG: hypothetical protein GC190_13965 [Alphaproteobacteria bacterium]|nr:hypothetical protein [Alphaproteobacteria bacterium]